LTKLKLRAGEWVVVCDGAKALVLENAGDDVFPDLKTREVYEQDDPKTHEQGTDAPGRVFSSVGSRRSAVEQTDWHEQAERRFLEQLVDRLTRAVMSGESKSIVIVAPPRVLGTIRQASPPTLRAAVHGELDKDLVSLPVYEIEKRLVGDVGRRSA
jgi:protein required for attachment to host cells